MERNARFTDEEVATFVDCYDRMPRWSAWTRRSGQNGEDVLEVTVDGRRPRTLKLARSQRFGYLVTGFDGWGLTVCDDFTEVLSILSRFSPGGQLEQAARPALSLAG